MTKDEIAELRELGHEATPGPWSALWREPGVLAAPMVYTADGKPPAIAVVHGGNIDASLIVAARNALPRLLEERERLLEALRAAHAFADRTCRGTGWNENGPALRERLGAAIAFAEAPTSKEQPTT